jgi:hypothetical protein
VLSLVKVNSAASLPKNVVVPDTDLTKRGGYPLRCNGEDIWHQDAKACWDRLYAWGREGKRTRAVAEGGIQACIQGSAHVTVYLWESNVDTTVPCNEIADTVQLIWDTCGVKGGSAQAPNGAPVVVHLTE